MALGIGIVGLPNVGKSTTFNALTKTQNAEVANYPFCTIQPNRAIVPVPDPRVDKLAELVKPEKVIYATVEFVDIAGLVKGASQGEGLGNQFLANIRETAAIVHVVRCFDDPNVVHVSAKPNPREDIEVINLELILADLQQLERKLDRLAREAKGDRKLQPQLEVAQALKEQLEQGLPVAAYPDLGDEAYQALNRELRFITGKKVIYVANVDEEHLIDDNEYVQQVRELAQQHNAEFVKLCAKLEEDMAGLTRRRAAGVSQLDGRGGERPRTGHPPRLSCPGADQLLHGRPQGSACVDGAQRRQGARSGRRDPHRL